MPREFAKTTPQGRFSRIRDDDRDLAALARRQHGVIARRQLIERGWSETAIDKRIRAARLHRLHAGVYSVGHRLLTREGHWMAAVLACGPEALLSHWSAAALWGIRPTSRSRVDVTVPHGSRSSKRICRHVSSVPGDERSAKERIPATSVHRTIFDLAAAEDADTMAAMIREAEYLELYDRLSLWDLLERYPGKRGSRKVNAALKRLEEEPGGRQRSKLEGRFAPFLRRYRLPYPASTTGSSSARSATGSTVTGRGTRQIVELDGWKGHRTRSAFREDRARDRALRVAGYSVTRLTWNQLDDEPEALASDLAMILRAGREKSEKTPKPG